MSKKSPETRMRLLQDHIGFQLTYIKSFKAFFQILQNRDAALLFNTLIDFHNYLESFDKTKDGWFFITIEKIRDLLCMPYKAQLSAFQVLTDAGLIKKKTMGLPPKRHVKINYKRMEEMLLEWAETANLYGPFSSKEVAEMAQLDAEGEAQVEFQDFEHSDRGVIFQKEKTNLPKGKIEKTENAENSAVESSPRTQESCSLGKNNYGEREKSNVPKGKNRIDPKGKIECTQREKHNKTTSNKTKSSENTESTKVLSTTGCAVVERATPGSLTGARKSRKDRAGNSGKSLSRFSEEVQAWAKSLNKILHANSASRRLPSAETIAQEIRRVQAKGILTDEQITAALAWAQENYSTNEYCRKIRAVKDVAAAIESWANQAARNPKARTPKGRLEKFEKSTSASEATGENTPAGKYSGSVSGYKRTHSKRAREDHAVKARQRVQEERRPTRDLGGPIDWDEVS